MRSTVNQARRSIPEDLDSRSSGSRRRPQGIGLGCLHRLLPRITRERASAGPPIGSCSRSKAESATTLTRVVTKTK